MSSIAEIMDEDFTSASDISDCELADGSTAIGSSKIYPTRGRKRKSLIPTPKKRHVARGTLKNVSRSQPTPKKVRNTRSSKKKEEPSEMQQLEHELKALRNAVNTMQGTILKQQEEILNLNEKLAPLTAADDNHKPTEPHPQLMDEVKALDEKMVNFYSDNEKTCTEKKNQLRKELNIPLNRIEKTADQALQLAVQLQENPPCVKCDRCLPQSDTLSNIHGELDKLEHEVAGIQSALNDFNLPNAATVGQKNKKGPIYTFGQNPDSKESHERAQKPEEKRGVEQKQNSNKNNSSRKKIVMFMDSNRNHLDQSLLWDNLTLVPAGCIPELEQIILKYDLRDYDVVIIHVGVNDLDTKSGTQVANRLIKLTSSIKTCAPGIKIILSEITPRSINKDDEVLACNDILGQVLGQAENITLVRHTNLRNKEWTHHKKSDDKHFTKTSISRLAGNLKHAFRKAIGIKGVRKLPRNTNNPGSKTRANNRGMNNRSSRYVNALPKDELRTLLKEQLRSLFE